MLDSEFLPQIQEILASCTHTSIQKAVFSATLPAGAEKIAMEILRNPIRIVVGLKCVTILDTVLMLLIISLRQRYTSSSHISVFDLRCRRSVQITQPLSTFISAL